MSNLSFTKKSTKFSFRQGKRTNSKTKSSTHHSLQLSTHSHRSYEKDNKNIINNEEITGIYGKPLSFYFDSSARKRLVIKTVDKFILPSKNPQEQFFGDQNPKSERRFSKTSHNPRRKKVNQVGQRLGATFDNFNLKNIQSIVSQEYNKTLPVISEIYEDNQFRPFSENRQRRKQHYQNKLLSGRSIYTSSFLENHSTVTQNKPQQSQKKLTECQFYKISKFRDGKELKKAKKFSFQGTSAFSTEKKVKDLGVPVYWQKQVFSNTLVYPIHKSVRQQLFSMINFQNGNEKVYKIFPKPYHKKLFQNENQWLFDIIVEICKQLNKVQGKVMNNKLILDNVYVLQEKKIRIQDWSCSSIRQILKVITQTFTNHKQPNLRGKSEWVCNPFYLAPEVLDLEERDFEKIEQLWKSNPTASDMWSLGLMIFQILTFIPIDMNERTSVKGKNILRKGLLALGKFDKQELNKRQKYLANHYKQFIEKECENLGIDRKILQVLEGTLVYEKSKRISASMVLQIVTGKKQ